MTRFKIIIVASAFVWAAGLQGQGKPQLKLDISEKKINMTADEKGGGAKIVYSPGDTIEYRILARNTGTGVMVQPEIVDPVPEGVKYVIGSARGENCRMVFSVNKGMAYSVWPVMVTATNANGVKIERPARTEEVTHIKWIVKDKLAPGGKKELSFRVVVE
jgi:uncharacterized repeat protein (TIGR01451 family)